MDGGRKQGSQIINEAANIVQQDPKTNIDYSSPFTIEK